MPDKPEYYCNVLSMRIGISGPSTGYTHRKRRQRRNASKLLAGFGWSHPTSLGFAQHSTAIDEMWETVEQAYFEGRITSQQRGLFRWAAQKAKEAESRGTHCGAPVQNL